MPFDRYKNPKILDATNLSLVREALKGAEIICGDFSLVLEYAGPGTFVYLAPPYHPLSDTANFTSYTADALGADDRKRLVEVFRELARKGCQVMLSNSDTPFIR